MRHTDPKYYYFLSFQLWNLHYPNLKSKNAFSASLVFIFFLNIYRETSVFITFNILFHNNTVSITRHGILNFLLPCHMEIVPDADAGTV